MANQIIEQYEKKLQTLLKENMELFSENMRLKYGSDASVKVHQQNRTHKRLPMSVMKANKQKNLLIVAEEYQNNTPVEVIAERIGMSVPTVRAYITELRKNNKLA